MVIISIILQILLGLGFLRFGLSKFNSPKMVAGFDYFGYPGWFRVFTGVAEIIAAILLFIGIWSTIFAAWGGLIVVATMIGAILTHMKMKDTLQDTMTPIVLFVLGLVVLLVNGGSLLG